MKINKELLPIKAHYFFFMAAMGPILPQITVYGKQLGIAPDVMGLVTSILPILYVLAKPGIGFLADYFTSCRKFIFVILITVMTLCFAGFYFIPQKVHAVELTAKFNFSVFTKDLNNCDNKFTSRESLCTVTRKIECRNQYKYYLFHFQLTPIDNSNSANLTTFLDSQNKSYHLCLDSAAPSELIDVGEHELFCQPKINSAPECIYNTTEFWIYLILMCAGTIGFNVTNCISDAVCFDVLGESEEMKYGAQRVWGTIGFGLTALIAGITVDMSTSEMVKSFTPALIIMLICSGFDIFSASKLSLPKLSSESISRDVWTLIKQSRVALFLVFATIAGILDSFIIYFMFWHLEEVAEKTGYMNSIKLIEGCVVAAECLCGEIPMFLFSGKILKKLGYVHCLSLCFFTYSIRLGLISLIPNPWWLVPIELVMQGCTYALCYTCIVAYASAIAPPGTSATVQGLVAGMDDGLGFAIGSLIGGQCFKRWGGVRSFQIFSLAALATCICHIFLRPASIHETHAAKQKGYVIPNEQCKSEQKS